MASEPGAAILLGVVAIIGYIIWSKQQKIRAAKRAEEKRKEAIILARQREDLYVYDSSIRPSDKRSTNNIFENPREWAESIQERYDIAKKHIRDAELVLNDDIDKFSQYRNQLQSELIPKYEAAIRPFFQELRLIDKNIPTPKELRVALDFVYPNDLQPDVIHKDLNRVYQGFSRSLANTLQGKDLTKLQGGDRTSIAIAAAMSTIFYLFTASQQRTKLEKLQADVDLVCEQISGAIKTYGRAAEEIKHTKLVHEVARNYMLPHLDTVLQLSYQGNKFSELQKTEKKAVETCYRGGEALKQIMGQEIITSINRSS
ncbi:MAG: hypothetical protein F6K41_20260 [Symploca sp. SIO3E6]|nr:hypothetical protein [Caldora sp. SIO3E6]